MKITIYCVLFCLWGPQVSAQKIVVLDVYDGRARLEGHTKDLQPGDIIQVEAPVKYYDKKCEVLCRVDGKGIMRLSFGHDPRQGLKSGVTVFKLIKDFFIPVKQAEILGHKAGNVGSSLNDVADYLVPYAQQPLLVLDELVIPLKRSAFPDRAEQFFFLQYMIDGAEHRKTLSFQENMNGKELIGLKLDTTVATIENNRYDRKKIEHAELWYINTKTEMGEQVASFAIKVLAFSEIKKALQLISGNALRDCPDGGCILPEMNTYLLERYGQIDPETLKHKLKENGIKF